MLCPYCSAQAVGEHLLVESGKTAYSAYSVLRTQYVLRYSTCSTVPLEGGGQPVLSFEQCFILFYSFPSLLGA